MSEKGYFLWKKKKRTHLSNNSKVSHKNTLVFDKKEERVKECRLRNSELLNTCSKVKSSPKLIAEKIWHVKLTMKWHLYNRPLCTWFVWWFESHIISCVTLWAKVRGLPIFLWKTTIDFLFLSPAPQKSPLTVYCASKYHLFLLAD